MSSIVFNQNKMLNYLPCPEQDCANWTLLSSAVWLVSAPEHAALAAHFLPFHSASVFLGVVFACLIGGWVRRGRSASRCCASGFKARFMSIKEYFNVLLHLETFGACVCLR